MSTEVIRGCTPPEFKRVLQSAKFIDRVSAVGKYTLNTAAEGGFVVYKNRHSGKLSISAALVPTAEEREKERQERNEIARVWDHSDKASFADAIDMSRLTCAMSGGGPMRRDIGVAIHSHVGGEAFSRPSLPDLWVYEGWRGRSPGLIAGILTVEETMAQVLFYKESSSRQVNYFHNQLDREPTASKMIALMNENGFNTAVANLDMATGRYAGSLQGVVDALYC